MALAKMMMPLSGEGNQLFRVPSIFLLFFLSILLMRILFTEQGNFAATYDREGR
jgi:hypothetical protein